MAKGFGWLTTGRDIEAVNLLELVYKGTKEGDIDGHIAYIFLNREEGQGPFSDRIIELARQWGVPVVTLSSERFSPQLLKDARRNSRLMDEWREEFHLAVLERLKVYEARFSVLAGYMLIVGVTMCNGVDLINLHPALPQGPKGTWQEVIWELIRKGCGYSGVMVHKVMPELDQGPVITYCEYSIRGGRFLPLWDDMQVRLQGACLDEVILREGEKNRLFSAIRQEGVKKERPLLFETIRYLSSERLELRGQVVYFDGKPYENGVCLNDEIERAFY